MRWSMLIPALALCACSTFDAPESDYWIPDFISRSYPDYKTLPTRYVDQLPDDPQCKDGEYGCVVITIKSLNSAVCQPYVRSYLTGDKRECVRYHEQVAHCEMRQRHPPNHPPTLGMVCGNGRTIYELR